MKKLIQASLLALGTCVLGSSPALAQDTSPLVAKEATSVLRLRSGAILWGQVVEHSSDVLRFRRIDTGGVVSLPWGLLDPVEEAELRLEYGYVELASEELMVDAERFSLRDGTEILGILDGRDTQFLWIKNAEGRLPLPLQNLQGAPARVRVPALEIYTRQELYLAKSSELGIALVAAGRTGAQAHDELAKYCERLFDYEHAYEHYSYVDQLDSTYAAARIGDSLSRAKLKAEQQEQLDVLSAIDLHSARGRFDRALAALTLFEDRYPDSPLREDWVKLRDRVKKAQLRAVKEQVRLSVYSWTTRLAREAVREKKDYASMLAYLEDDLNEALFESVRGDLVRLAPEIEVGEIKQIWLQRKRSGARPATYGVGTWLLGKERAHKMVKKPSDKDKAEDGKPKKASRADALKQLDERLEKYYKNLALTRKSNSGASASEEDEAERFWNLWNYTSRWHWAQAYFVENSELFQVSSTTFSKCRTCGGSGVLDYFSLGGSGKPNKNGTLTTPCPTCHTLGVVRRLRYR